jgi:endonuclease/exonuclease/phosphatase family metal-dependent hydrolase
MLRPITPIPRAMSDERYGFLSGGKTFSICVTKPPMPRLIQAKYLATWHASPRERRSATNYPAPPLLSPAPLFPYLAQAGGGGGGWDILRHFGTVHETPIFVAQLRVIRRFAVVFSCYGRATTNSGTLNLGSTPLRSICVRLVSYNILDGGEGRADPLAEVIEAQRPDVVVLVEADVGSVVERIARRLKMEFVVGEGKKHGGAILARGGILESVNHSLLREEFSDCVLEATVSLGALEWVVTAVHLHARARFEDEAVREKEIDAILGIFGKHRAQGRAHLLAGDFNANSPVQEVVVEDCKPRTREDIAKNGGVLPRTAVQKLISAGYVDTLEAAMGEKAGRVGSFTTQFPGQRVDYIFSFGVEPSRLREARVETDRLAKYASDHFPVMVEIE